MYVSWDHVGTAGKTITEREREKEREREESHSLTINSNYINPKLPIIVLASNTPCSLSLTFKRQLSHHCSQDNPPL